jgi:hypothetical protein
MQHASLKARMVTIVPGYSVSHAIAISRYPRMDKVFIRLLAGVRIALPGLLLSCGSPIAEPMPSLDASVDSGLVADAYRPYDGSLSCPIWTYDGPSGPGQVPPPGGIGNCGLHCQQ